MGGKLRNEKNEKEQEEIWRKLSTDITKAQRHGNNITGKRIRKWRNGRKWRITLFLRDKQFVVRSRNVLFFWAIETAPECSHGPATCPCAKPVESSQNLTILQDQCYSQLALPSCLAIFLLSYMYWRSWPFRLPLFRHTNRLRWDVDGIWWHTETHGWRSEGEKGEWRG